MTYGTLWFASDMTCPPSLFPYSNEVGRSDLWQGPSLARYPSLFMYSNVLFVMLSYLNLVQREGCGNSTNERSEKMLRDWGRNRKFISSVSKLKLAWGSVGLDKLLLVLGKQRFFPGRGLILGHYK